MTELKPYPSYQDTTIDWAPSVPAGWESASLARVASIFAGGTPDRTNADFWSDGSIPWLNSGSVNNEIITSPSELITRAAATGSSTRWAHSGSVLIALAGQGKTKGMAARLEISSTFNQSLAAIVPRANLLDYRFLRYWLSTNYQSIRNMAGGDRRDGLNLQHIGAIQTPLPPLRDQQSISRFLDRETAEIDAFIADQEELIGLLAERRVSVLLQATLGGHIEVRGQLGRFIRKEERPILGPETVTAFRDGQVTARSNRREDGFTMSEADSGYQGVAAGDLVFHGLDGFAGAVGVSDSRGRCSPVYHVCSVKTGINGDFMGLYLRALGIAGFLEAHAWSVRQRSVDYRNWTTFSKLPVGLISRHDQEIAVARVKADWSELDATIADAREAIALSRERRAALISAAVTGKIDVREHGAVA